MMGPFTSIRQKFEALYHLQFLLKKKKNQSRALRCAFGDLAQSPDHTMQHGVVMGEVSCKSEFSSMLL